MNKMDSKELIARRVAREIEPGMLVNLGIGLPSLVAGYVDARLGVFFQAENGVIGLGARPPEGMHDKHLTDAGGAFVTAVPGAASIDSAMSFGLIRGGHLDMTVLGGLEVDEAGRLANWKVPGKMVPGMGGAMDLVTGAKRVVVSAPIKDADDAAIKGATILMSMNEDKLETCQISSNASCTTNASSPLIAILDEAIGIEKAILNTVHAYTASQSLVDGPAKKDLREGRAAAQNIVPSSTGAAIAVTKVATQLAGKFDGISIRVPVVTGSIVDVTFISKRPTSAEEVNTVLKKAAAQQRWNGIFAVTEEPLVSHDIIGNRHASIADLEMTRVVDGNLVKVLAWYDNEMGYTYTLVDHVVKAGRLS